MAEETNDESYLELYDIATKEIVARTPLAAIQFIPRTGERIFIPLHGPGSWSSYTVIAVEYFLGYEGDTAAPARSVSNGMGRISLYVESAK
jgi:hypothetical protein